MLDFLLNKVSKYLQRPSKGDVVDVESVKLDIPKQIQFARLYLDLHEKHDTQELKKLLSFNPVTTPWCAGFVNAIEKMCGRKGTGKLLARSYLEYGKGVTTPKLGDIVVLKRGNSSWQGHVGYYIERDTKGILVLGGNQSNKVCYKYYNPGDLLGYRRP
jgi:uncharacterized protein (TIGR02594 family)